MTELTTAQRRVILTAAVLGWLCAGVEMGLGPLLGRPALKQLFAEAVPEAVLGIWYGRYLCAFLLGGAFGGLIFGRLGDRAGRVRALGLSVLCFSLFTGASWFVQTPEQFVALRFVASLGIGGSWPAGVSLVSEAWPAASRPTVAGLMGAAANVGILLMALIGLALHITPETWRTATLIGMLPVVLGFWTLLGVSESPTWLAGRGTATTPAAPIREVVQPPLLGRLLLGIGLGTVPLLGTWASGKWLYPWADSLGMNAARAQLIWSSGAVLGGALGGWLAVHWGRRTTYSLVSLATLIINLVIYRWLDPRHSGFLPAVFLLGLVATVFFGWLPLYLPELFPTRVRATGLGISFNFGRFATAAGVLTAGELMKQFDGDYARVGEVTAWVYVLGLFLILFAPDTTKSELRT